MNAFDVFCNDLLEEAKRFNEKSNSESNLEGKKAYQHASLLLTICALEAYINSISEEITIAKAFPIHEKGILLEKEVKLQKGEWVLTDNLKMSRLTDKVELLYKRHTGIVLENTQKWWPILKTGIECRNKITHPKSEVIMSNDFCEKVIRSVIECLAELYKAVYKRKFPKSHLSIISKLDF